MFLCELQSVGLLGVEILPSWNQMALVSLHHGEKSETFENRKRVVFGQYIRLMVFNDLFETVKAFLNVMFLIWPSQIGIQGPY